MKNLVWICILALLFCACRKDKDEEYEVPSEQLTEIQNQAEEIICRFI